MQWKGHYLPPGVDPTPDPLDRWGGHLPPGIDPTGSPDLYGKDAQLLARGYSADGYGDMSGFNSIMGMRRKKKKDPLQELLARLRGQQSVFGQDPGVSVYGGSPMTSIFGSVR